MPFRKQFDVVIGNPPHVQDKSNKRAKEAKLKKICKCKWKL